MIEEKEAVNLLIGLAGLVVLGFAARRWRRPGNAMLGAGYACIVAAYVFTIVEGFVWPNFFNLLEHAGFAAAGILFAVALLRLSEPSPGETGEQV